MEAFGDDFEEVCYSPVGVLVGDVVVASGGELVEDLDFFLEDAVNGFVESVFGEEGGDSDGVGLADAVDAVFGLDNGCGCPFGFDEERLAGSGEGEAYSCCGDLGDEDVDVSVLEVAGDFVSFFCGGLPVVDGCAQVGACLVEGLLEAVEDAGVDCPGDEGAAGSFLVFEDPAGGFGDFCESCEATES